MLEIILDTETTGLSVNENHKIVEICCVELENQIATNNTFHHYINPRKDQSRKKLTKFMGIQINFYLTKKFFQR